VSATVARRRGSGLTRERVQAEVARFLSALDGGEDGRGWTFGRPVYKSELYQLLEGMAAVDHVADLRLFTVPPGIRPDDDGVSEVLLPAYGLVDAARERIEVTVTESA
jgi:hypothetical protein